MHPHLLLAAAEGLGPTPIASLLDPDLDAAATLATDPAALAIPPPARNRLRDAAALRREARSWLDAAARLDCDVLHPDDADYPTRLRSMPLRPLVLFARGATARLRDADLGVAVVGSRTPTAYGLAAARAFGNALATARIPLWSGLAVGVDAAAHEACLGTGTPTVAVLAGGLDHVYPSSHRGLVEQILAHGGAVVSELPPGRRPTRGHFPRRNRILGAATRAVLVVEAGVKSGTLHTARAAADAGVDVWAVPGPWSSPRSRGCHELIRDGAALAADPEDLLRQLGVAHDLAAARHDTDTRPRLERSADAQAVLRTLGAGPRPFDLSQRESGLGAAAFLRAVTTLLTTGDLTRLPGDLLAVQRRVD